VSIGAQTKGKKKNERGHIGTHEAWRGEKLKREDGPTRAKAVKKTDVRFSTLNVGHPKSGGEKNVGPGGTTKGAP